MFADISETTTFVRRQWLSVQEGRPALFQILDAQSTKFIVHVVHTSDNKWVKIPHRDDSELMNSPGFYKKHPKTAKYQVNVLDVTPYVVNEATNSKFPALNVRVPDRDPVNGDDLRELPRLPLNEVKILEGGVTLFGQLNGRIGTILAENPKAVISNVVFQIEAVGRGKNKITSVYPRMEKAPQDTSSYETPELILSDLSDAEISKLLTGTPLMDVFSARRDEEQAEEDETLDFTKGLPGL